MTPHARRLLALLALLGACAAQRVKVEPISVAPIHIEVDVTVHEGKHPPPPEKK